MLRRRIMQVGFSNKSAGSQLIMTTASGRRTKIERTSSLKPAGVAAWLVAEWRGLSCSEKRLVHVASRVPSRLGLPEDALGRS